MIFFNNFFYSFRFFYNFIYSEVRWLSAGQALKRLFELRVPVMEIIEQRASVPNVKKAKKIFKLVQDKYFWVKIGFLSDTLAVLNKTNKELQGSTKNHFEVSAFLLFNFFTVFCQNKKKIYKNTSFTKRSH